MRTVLVTGARRGIGLDVVYRLAAHGHRVYATVHRAESVEPTREALREYGDLVHVEKLDITNTTDRECAASWDIDVLINNAAVSESGPLLEIPIDTVRHVLDTNVLGTLALTQEIVRGMIQRKKSDARVIIVSSLMGVIPTPYRAPYGMSKWALENIGHSLRAELKPLGIAVILVNPGAYATGFNRESDDRALALLPPSSPYTEGLRYAAAFVAQNEVEDTASIAEEIVAAVEDTNPKSRYVAPWWQWVGRRAV